MVNSWKKTFRAREYYVPAIWNITKEAEKRKKEKLKYVKAYKLIVQKDAHRKNSIAKTTMQAAMET
jgi:hypothetical protein